MTTWAWMLVLAIWSIVGAAVALLLGRVIHRGDENDEHDPYQ